MLPARVSNPGPLTYESDALPIAPRGPAQIVMTLIRLLSLFRFHKVNGYTFMFSAIFAKRNHFDEKAVPK